jgi:hypothetical protein
MLLGNGTRKILFISIDKSRRYGTESLAAPVTAAVLATGLLLEATDVAIEGR